MEKGPTLLRSGLAADSSYPDIDDRYYSELDELVSSDYGLEMLEYLINNPQTFSASYINSFATHFIDKQLTAFLARIGIDSAAQRGLLHEFRNIYAINGQSTISTYEFKQRKKIEIVAKLLAQQYGPNEISIFEDEFLSDIFNDDFFSNNPLLSRVMEIIENWPLPNKSFKDLRVKDLYEKAPPNSQDLEKIKLSISGMRDFFSALEFRINPDHNNVKTLLNETIQRFRKYRPDIVVTYTLDETFARTGLVSIQPRRPLYDSIVLYELLTNSSKSISGKKFQQMKHGEDYTGKIAVVVSPTSANTCGITVIDNGRGLDTTSSGYGSEKITSTQEGTSIIENLGYSVQRRNIPSNVVGEKSAGCMSFFNIRTVA